MEDLGSEKLKTREEFEKVPTWDRDGWFLQHAVMIDMTINPLWDIIDCVRVCLLITYCCLFTVRILRLGKSQDLVFCVELHLLSSSPLR